MKYIIEAQNIKDTYKTILNRAKEFKEKRIYPTYKASCALFFEEPSTRTRLSFEKAAKNLGCETYYIQGNFSSAVKGESFFDTLLSFKKIGIDLVIFRISDILFDYEDLINLNISLINAGDSTHEHPSQGLLDVFTLLEKTDTLKNKNILYVGDVYHSRVFRSGAYFFKLEGANVGVCGYPSFIPKDYPFMDKAFTNLDEALDWADHVIALRIQKERHKEAYNLESYFDMYGITEERYNKIKGFLMHPGPVNRNLDIDGELLYKNKSLIANQIENGVFVRMAMIEHILG